jgi:glutaredoxin
MYGNYGPYNGGYGDGGGPYGGGGFRYGGMFGGPRRRPLPQSPLYPGLDLDAQEEGGLGAMRSGYGYSYAGYIERQANMYPIMMYTLVGCVPCQRAKHVLAVSYADVRSHFLELAGDEEWQRQLQVDLQHITGALTFPYIFICGSYIGGTEEGVSKGK